MMPQPSLDPCLVILVLVTLALSGWLAATRAVPPPAWWQRRDAHPHPLTIMVADASQHRELDRALRAALRQLGSAHGAPCPASAIVVQRLVWDGWGGEHGRQVHGCAQRPPGFAADPRPQFRLALEVDGRALPVDEVLATLAELWALPARGDDRAFVPIVFHPVPPRRLSDRAVPARPLPVLTDTDD